MRTNYYFHSILTLIAIAIFSVVVTPQVTEGTPPETPRSVDNKPPNARTEALRKLDLSRDQAQRIRRLNGERKPLMDAAQKRLRETNRSLDEAIYADTVNEADVHARLKDFQLAQAEVAKIRFMNELAVRRILTPEQLIRFRRMRERFEQKRDNSGDRMPARGKMRDDSAINRGAQPPVENVVKPDQKKPGF